MVKNTKQEIFDTALILFAKRGYSQVSIRELAYTVGIKESSIYNHYSSKKEILDHIFKEFKHCINRYYITKKKIDKYAQIETAEKLINRFVIIFSNNEVKLIINTYRIILTQQFVDTYAKELLMNTTIRRMTKSFKYALDRLMYYQKIPYIDSEKFAIIWSESLFAKVIVLTHSFYDSVHYEIARKRYTESLDFIKHIVVKGIKD